MAVLSFCLLWCISGCDPAADTTGTTTKPATAPAAPLRVVVVDDQELAAIAQREWLAVSETKLELTRLTSAELEAQIASGSFSTDAIIYPTDWLGPLVEADVITPMPRRIRESESFDEKDLMPWVRRGELAWGEHREQIYAVPLGSVLLTMVVKDKADDAAADDDLPETWAELAAWRGGELRTAQPLAEGWAAYSFFARSAAYVRSRGQVSTIFDVHTMDPLIDSPPYVRALEELVAAAKSAPEQIDWTPWDVQQALFDDKCDVGLTWMSPSIGEADEDGDSTKFAWSFAELPGSDEVYRTSENDWGPRPDNAVVRVPLIGVPGRIGSVANKSRRQRAAWSLLVKLSGELANRVSSSSRHTGPFRMSQQAARPWVDRRISSTDAREYGVAATTAYSRNLVFHSLRIPGHKEYLQSLDAAVRSAVAGEGEPAELLKKVADEWQKITESRGVEKQIEAYKHNLGR